MRSPSTFSKAPLSDNVICRLLEAFVTSYLSVVDSWLIDDIVDLIKDEADKDYQLAAGISSEVEANDSIFQLSKARLPWLFLGLLGGLGSVFILKDFEQIMSEPDL